MLVIILGHVTPPHEFNMLHITSHVGHHCGTYYTHMNLMCCILLRMSVIILGHVTPHMNLRCCILQCMLVIILGHVTPHMNLRSCILLYMLVIILGHVTTK